MNDLIKKLADHAVQLTQNGPYGTCDMNKYNKVFAKLIIDECANRMEYRDDDRIVPRPTWQLYDLFGLDWKKDWYTNQHGIWTKK
jgi:hypothetical protein